MGAPKVKRLTEAQKARLRKHSVNHSDNYMRSMRMNMARGLTFEEADRKAKASYGK
jgi:hypothetical protein